MTRKRDEFVMQLIGNQNSLRTWIRPTEDFHVVTLELQPVFSAYELHT